jgi:hypothetical protein
MPTVQNGRTWQRSWTIYLSLDARIYSELPCQEKHPPLSGSLPPGEREFRDDFAERPERLGNGDSLDRPVACC